MSLRRPKPPIKGGSAPEEEEELYLYYPSGPSWPVLRRTYLIPLTLTITINCVVLDYIFSNLCTYITPAYFKKQPLIALF